MNIIKEKIKNTNPIDLERIKRLVFWAKGKKQYPVITEIYPTSRCNLKCIYCKKRNEDGLRIENKELRTKDWIRIIKELGRAKIKRVTCSGGEPLCKEGIGRIFKRIKKEGLEGHLLTNGTLLNKNLIKLLVNIKWDSIALSLDSANPKIHDSLRGKGSFKKIIKSIKIFSNLKKNRFSKPFLGITATLTNKNYKDLPNLVKLANKLGCAHVAIIPLVVHHKEGQKLMIEKKHEKSLQKYLKKAYKLAGEYGITAPLIKQIAEKKLARKSHNLGPILKTSFSPAVRFNPLCIHPFTLLTIKDDGTTSPCPFSKIDGEKFDKNKRLGSLWFGKTFTKFREAMLKHEIPRCCSTCSVPKVLESNYLKVQVKKVIATK